MSDGASSEPRYPMRVVTARTGVSADALRAWERRYGAVRPQRTAGGQRLYSDDDVARLTLLHRATLEGHGIAGIARLDRPALEALFARPPALAAPTAAPTTEAVDALVADAMAATERLDAPALEAVLERGALALGAGVMVDRVVARFLRQVGERWHAGTLSPAHEHLASAALRRVLAWIIATWGAAPRAPRLVVATPAGELHEFGAMLAAAAAAEEGWQVVYLGASLPARDVAAAAAQVEARAVALSAVHADGAATLAALRETARALPAGTVLLVGGAAAERHGTLLRDAGAHLLPDMPALRRALGALRDGGADDGLAAAGGGHAPDGEA